MTPLLHVSFVHALHFFDYGSRGLFFAQCATDNKNFQKQALQTISIF